MKRILLLAVLVSIVGCSGGGGDLSKEECRQLLTKISEVMYSELSAADRAEVADSPAELETRVAECVEEQPWNKSGLECVLAAETESELKRCILDL